MTEIVKELIEEVDTIVFYGVNNVNIRLIKDLCPKVKIVARGRMMKLSSEDENEVENLACVVDKLMMQAAKTNVLTEETVLEMIKVNEIPEVKTERADAN